VTNYIKKVDDAWIVFSANHERLETCANEQEAKRAMAEMDFFEKKANYVQIVNSVNTSSIRVERDDAGDEIIIVPSYTMPDDIVMNGILYPAAEIEKSYYTLEGTPAPIGHPIDKQGDFVSASSEIGINRFHAGVFNGVVKREGNRLYVEKRVNVNVAKRTTQGEMLINALRDIMEGQRDDPIHTSTGIYLEVNSLDYPRTNDQGKEYNGIASNMFFDHDAILLNEEGAATPQDGVGMLVNKRNENTLNVMRVNLDSESTPDNDKNLLDKLIDLIKSVAPAGQTSYDTDNGQGGREDENNKGNDEMKDYLLKLLRANKVEIADDATDTEIQAAHDKLMATNKADDESEPLIEAINNALAPINAKIESLESTLNANSDAEKESLVADLEKIGFEKADVEGMTVNAMKKTIAMNSKPAHYTGGHFAPNHSTEDKFETSLSAYNKES
jgi:hypothetical protein